MNKYQIKNNTIEAIRWFPGMNIDGIIEILPIKIGKLNLCGKIAHNGSYISIGDYLVRDNNNEFIAIDSDKFQNTYIPIDDLINGRSNC